jgi:hypothetical protein
MAPLHGGFSAGKSDLCCGLLARRCGPSGFAPIRPHFALLCWLFLPRPTKEWPYDLLGPWAFREVFYSFSGPGGYLSPTVILTQPPVEIGYFHWRFCYTNRQWKYPISTGGCVKITAIGNRFPLAVPKPGLPRFFTGVR